MEENLLIQAVRVMDPQGPHHQRTCDVRIAQGVVTEIGHDLPANGADIWFAEGSCLSPGWVDAQAHFRDPGEEVKEGLESGARAAAAGGFTDVAVLPSTAPCLDHNAEIQALLRRAERLPVDVHPIGALSSGLAGKSLAELCDLRGAGAVGFSDDGPVHHPELLRRALEYAADLGVAVWSLPLETRINPEAVMHEGLTSTQMGLMGSPAIAETMRLHRDLELVRYTGGRLHIPLLTTAAGVQLVREAKAEGLHVTCSASAHHLLFCDADLIGFNGTLRNRSPFRDASDRDALRAGLRDGTLDAVVSDHRPEDLEHHDVEFMLTADGLAGIETAFAAAWTGMGQDGLEGLVGALTHGPRSVLGLPRVHVEVGTPARLTWFDSAGVHPGTRDTRGVNVPDYAALTGGPLTGRALGTVRAGFALRLRPADH